MTSIDPRLAGIARHVLAAGDRSCPHSGDLDFPCRHCLRKRIAYRVARETAPELWAEKNREASRTHYWNNHEAEKARKRSDPAGWYRAAERRAQRAGNRVEEVCRWDVFEKTDGRCHICGRAIPSELEDSTAPLYFEVDHIVPSSNGGALAFENLMPSHRLCNATRGNRELTDEVAIECREKILPHLGDSIY